MAVAIQRKQELFRPKKMDPYRRLIQYAESITSVDFSKPSQEFPVTTIAILSFLEKQGLTRDITSTKIIMSHILNNPDRNA